jgi:hypothetical protein
VTFELHPDAHPSETRTPIIASIVSFGIEDPGARASLATPLGAAGLASMPVRLDIPTSTPAWSAGHGVFERVARCANQEELSDMLNDEQLLEELNAARRRRSKGEV